MQITIVGSGNVAIQLGLAFKEAGHKIVSVIGRSTVNVKRAAQILKAPSATGFKKIPASDFIIIAVSDSAIPSIVKKLKTAFRSSSSIVLHTSGSVPIDVLKTHFTKCGVIYPVQTISANDYINFQNVPFCIEASGKTALSQIKKLAASVSDNVQVMPSQKRKILHLSAVIANNFSNHLFTLAESVLHKHSISFDLLKPLIEKTAEKINTVSPSLTQTGPAKRGDKKVIKEHLKLLSYNKTLKQVYALLSKSIEKKK
ncbi:MAG TPA: DUF2520 domain-containing protein [Bacteroidia bacterium]|nr:DUF2520 domain-containing protein [Bacteroidia bacterium]HNU33169.1 DUF2520 domain-containing protein [Bacteroidia bacterium]